MLTHNKVTSIINPQMDQSTNYGIHHTIFLTIKWTNNTHIKLRHELHKSRYLKNLYDNRILLYAL